MKTILSILILVSSFSMAKADDSSGVVTLVGSVSVSPLFAGTKSVLVEKGEVLFVSEGLEKASIEIKVKQGFAAYAKDDEVMVQDCKDALIQVSAEEGNFIPNADGTEVYKMPKVLNFKCNDTI
jgi:hypothetical protein